MITDLWTAVTYNANHRPHPVAAALLYAFCPTAAYWYLAGAVPNPPFDPAWQVLSHRAQAPEKGLKQWLAEWGLSALEMDVYTYYYNVKSARTNHPIPAPETLPIFRYSVPPERRFGLQNPINDHFAGKWDYFIEYVRVWLVVSRDWLNYAQLPQKPDLKQVFLPISPGGNLPPLHYPFWLWTTDDQTSVLSLILSPSELEPIRHSLLEDAARPRFLKKQQTRAYVFNPTTGQVSSPLMALPTETFRSWIADFALLARSGPYPPLRAAQGRSACQSCAFTHLCYLDKELNPQLNTFTTLRHKSSNARQTDL